MKYNVTMDGQLIRENIDAERLARFIKRLKFEGGRQQSENVYISQFGCVVKVVAVEIAEGQKELGKGKMSDNE